jgi:hypothetical protein
MKSRRDMSDDKRAIFSYHAPLRGLYKEATFCIIYMSSFGGELVVNVYQSIFQSLVGSVYSNNTAIKVYRLEKSPFTFSTKIARLNEFFCISPASTSQRNNSNNNNAETIKAKKETQVGVTKTQRAVISSDIYVLYVSSSIKG